MADDLRRNVTKEMPSSLEMLEPLLVAIGFRWSNHYQSDENRVWCHVHIKSGKAGRVGMTEKEAIDTTIRAVINHLQLKDSLIHHSKGALELALKRIDEYIGDL